MPGRKNPPHDRDDEALREYRMRERVEGGEKVAGDEAGWLDRRGTAANAARRGDADTRRAKTKEGRGR